MALQNSDVFLVNRSGTSYKVNFSDISNSVTGGGDLLKAGEADVKTAGNLRFNDNVKLTAGSSDDLQIYHDTSHSYIAQTGTGNLRITSTGNVSLYYNGAEKIVTTNTGVTVTGKVVATGFSLSTLPLLP